MIIYMIYSHIAQISAMDMTDEYQILLKVFFCFMTWFFFKAGLLFTPPLKKIGFSKDYLKKIAAKLLVPFVFFVVVSLGVHVICLFFNGESWWHLIVSEIKSIICNEAPIANLPLWFLATFLIVKTVGQLITSFQYAFVILLSSFVLAYVASQFKTGFIWIGNIPLSLSFFISGYLLKSFYQKKMVIICSLLLIIFYIIHPVYIGVRSNEVVFGDYYYLGWLYSVSACIILVFFFKKYLDFSIPVLSMIGRESMIFFASHYLILYFTDKLYDSYLFNFRICGEYTEFLLLMISSIIFLPFFKVIFNSKYLSFAIGR